MLFRHLYHLPQPGKHFIFNQSIIATVYQNPIGVLWQLLLISLLYYNPPFIQTIVIGDCSVFLQKTCKKPHFTHLCDCTPANSLIVLILKPIYESSFSTYHYYQPVLPGGYCNGCPKLAYTTCPGNAYQP